MRAFKNHDAAHRFCREHGELRDLLRACRRHNQIVSVSLRRTSFARRMHRDRNHDTGMNGLHLIMQRAASGARPDRTV